MSREAVLPAGVTMVNHLDVSIVVSGTELGNMDLRFGNAAQVAANRAKLVQCLSPVRYVVEKARHDGEFIELSDIPNDELQEDYRTDGMFIDRPGIALGTNPADCIAMALYSKNTTALGVIHVGRRSVDAGIHETSIRHFVEAHEVGIDGVRAYFGPSVRQESYFYPDISAEQLADPKWNKFIDRRGGNHHIDLMGRVVKDMAELGVNPAQIGMHQSDTGADPNYFSHIRSSRTGEPEGRNGFAAMLRA